MFSWATSANSSRLLQTPPDWTRTKPTERWNLYKVFWVHPRASSQMSTPKTWRILTRCPNYITCLSTRRSSSATLSCCRMSKLLTLSLSRGNWSQLLAFAILLSYLTLPDFTWPYLITLPYLTLNLLPTGKKICLVNRAFPSCPILYSPYRDGYSVCITATPIHLNLLLQCFLNK